MSAPRPTTDSCDVLLVGGGLANSLIAIKLRCERPDLRVRMLEASSAPADDHTWSVFRPDLSTQDWTLLSPALACVWEAYAVAFPAFARTLDTPYASLTSLSLAKLAQAALDTGFERGVLVAEVAPHKVVCEGGRELCARVVIDGRGATPSRHISTGFQKFVGLELRLQGPHGLTRPVVMDATVRQEDGYRFVYVLPLGADRVLVEDTRYSDGAELSEGLARAVLSYAEAQGWRVAEVVRREQGVLPVVLGGDVDGYFAERPAHLPQVGMRGLFFHPTTGYSLPDACRVAGLVAADPLASSAALALRLSTFSKDLWRRRGFYRALKRMLFCAADPPERYRVLERFYRLPQPVIERFYAAQSTWADKLRIVSGRPPVRIGRALAALPARVAHA